VSKDRGKTWIRKDWSTNTLDLSIKDDAPQLKNGSLDGCKLRVMVTTTTHMDKDKEKSDKTQHRWCGGIGGFLASCGGDDRNDKEKDKEKEKEMDKTSGSQNNMSSNKNTKDKLWRFNLDVHITIGTDTTYDKSFADNELQCHDNQTVSKDFHL
jgi:hypothetical protein